MTTHHDRARKLAEAVTSYFDVDDDEFTANFIKDVTTALAAAHEAGRREEREACADLCETRKFNSEQTRATARVLAKAIRARSIREPNEDELEWGRKRLKELGLEQP